MNSTFTEFSTNASLLLSDERLLLSRTPHSERYYTFIWATTEPVLLNIDRVALTLQPNEIIALTPLHSIQYESGINARVYQFNRDFYCIQDHDKEVGCAGLLFFGNHQTPIIQLDQNERRSFELLHQVFLEELATKDTIQAEMLRMLTARLIIKITRIFKKSNNLDSIQDEKLSLFRAYNVLVENHFREEHSVSFYAAQLFKSPKTIANYFGAIDKSALQIIHDRIVLETKRLLRYTDKTSKEIAYELGFDDPSHLSRLFKKQTGQSPTDFKKESAPSLK